MVTTCIERTLQERAPLDLQDELLSAHAMRASRRKEHEHDLTSGGHQRLSAISVAAERSHSPSALISCLRIVPTAPTTQSIASIFPARTTGAATARTPWRYSWSSHAYGTRAPASSTFPSAPALRGRRVPTGADCAKPESCPARARIVTASASGMPK